MPACSFTPSVMALVVRQKKIICSQRNWVIEMHLFAITETRFDENRFTLLTQKSFFCSGVFLWLSLQLRIKKPKLRQCPANICWAWRRLQDVFKTCFEDVLTTSWRHVLKTSWRHYGDKTKSLLGMSVSKYVSNKSIFQKSIFDNSKANPKYIN